MKAKDLNQLGIPHGPAMTAAYEVLERARAAGVAITDLREKIRAVALAPEAHLADKLFGALAEALRGRTRAFVPRAAPAPYSVFGVDIDGDTLGQMGHAAALPVAVCGALMPDAHRGYGLPIGGVLATEGAVIPYAVGMDIACRMKLSVLDLPVTALATERPRLREALERETRFGVGASFARRREHAVMDDDWSVSPVTQRLKDKAWAQLGTSGSGNHFVELGELTVLGEVLGLAPGTYLALLSHSGSRGTGGEVATHYSRLARELHPELPKELGQLAWLDLESEAGAEYWAAMELMGRYAAANHALIHRHVREALGVELRADVENHHNFAWREVHVTPDGQRRAVVVHRKGATPAGDGVLGVIPGSMGTPGYVVRGRGEPSSLCSASHGAGRAMSRTRAKELFTWEQARAFLAAHHVELLSAGLDEVPMAYKDIDQVMAAQSTLVEKVARFEPRLVKMARGDERPED
ncbi:MAG TPA: RtcB family protein [Polyangia bacterium]|jgi:tRNA-splicing ligase RtcB